MSLVLRAGLTLLAALGAALLCGWLNTPIPWMIGPLLATAALTVAGAPTASLGPLRDGGQWVIGAALGLYFTPQMTALVAAAHSLRLLIVVVVIPFAMVWAKGWWGLQAIELAPSGPRPVVATGLLALAAATGAGGWLLRRAGRANPWFMGALLVAMGLTMAGVEWSAMPAGLSNAAQLVIGVSLGVRFSPAFLRTAPRWLAAVAAGTLVLMGLCAGFGVTLAWATGLHPATLILGTSPGGITEMAITAKVLQLGVPVVTALQVCRLVAVLLLVQPCYRLLDRRGFWSENS